MSPNREPAARPYQRPRLVTRPLGGTRPRPEPNRYKKEAYDAAIARALQELDKIVCRHSIG